MITPPAPRRLRRGHVAATVLATCALVATPTMALAAAPVAPLAATDAAAPAVVDEIIVGYDVPAAAPSADVLVDATSVDVDLTAVAEVSTGAEVLEVAGDLTSAELDTLVAELAATEGVAYVEPNIQATVSTNDPSYGQLWGLRNAPTGIDAPGAWAESTGEGAVVAVIDTGIQSHPDLDPNVLPGYDFVSNPATARDGNGRDANPADEGDWYGENECGENTAARGSTWHGTHVAGTIAAAGNNGQGIVGVAYDAQIVPVRSLAKCGGSLADIADGVIWAAGGSVAGAPANASPADVINMSLGGGSITCPATMQRAIDFAVGRGVTVVAAAGNDNQDAANVMPANCQGVVTVAALDIGGNRTFYSNYGTTVDVAAPGGETTVGVGGASGPGEGILSTLNSGTTTPGSPSYAEYQGTSMATPHVAAVAALLSVTEPSLTPAQIEQRLRATVNPIPGTCSGGCGAGIVDAAAALAAG